MTSRRSIRLKIQSLEVTVDKALAILEFTILPLPKAQGILQLGLGFLVAELLTF
jgi:hypothetical protein